MNRWKVVFGAILIQLCLGSVYSWSIFVNPLQNEFGFSNLETQVVFAVSLATFGIVMIFAGKWQDSSGPKIVASVAAVVRGVGYVVAALSGGSFLLIVLGYGVIGGSALGLAYVAPIAAGVKWFPDKKGLITGLSVAGFGGGAWIFAFVSENLIGSIGLLNTFFVLGGIFVVCILAGAQLLSNPPAGWKPDGWEPGSAENKKTEDFEWSDLFRTSQFYLLWFMFLAGAIAGLMVIGNLKPFGVDSGLSVAIAGAAVGVLALFNAGGRVAWGAISDAIGMNRSLALMFALQGAMMLFLINMGSTELTLAIASAWLGFNFGGNFALFPAITAEYFGTKNLGINYAMVFTSYGVAGIIGPILGGAVRDATGSFEIAFIPAGVVCLVAAVLAFLLKRPSKV
jgi:OFA family oxalate/formate antiporter-like MFS transporter